MAIVGVPGWIGASAVQETGQRWMKEAGAAVRIGAPFWMSQLAGQSKEITITLGANHNYDRNDLINKLRALGSTPAVVVISGDLVAQTTGVPCLEFPSNLPNAYITLRNNATIYGRGGQGGTAGVKVGQNGGPCILNSIGTKLRIENNGSICGGGGGGGGSRVGQNLVSGGSGGRPFGAAGIGEGRDKKDGIAGTLAAPGPQPPDTRYGSHGGAGGNVGAAGAPGNKAGNQAEGYAGGQPGAALYGSVPTWTKLGNIYGSRL
ncbi:receptor-recognizing protein [Enterobacter kobei]|uniref:receptor-recognizing protein n=1 Tax=Enterobacter kobei TaxID=208224 RepID=UPI0020066E19|nr:receptor-recognizing protein [Enterobacter kobei]MCK6891120.1 receptor-recognizing protein [Enterobacter kobei]